MKFLKRALKRVLLGGRKYARIFRHDGKIYMVDKSNGKFVYWSVTFKNFVKRLFKTNFTTPMMISFNFVFALCGVVLVPILFSSFLVSLPIVVILFVLANFALSKLFTFSEDAALPFMALPNRPNSIAKYAGKDTEKLVELLPHLSERKIVEMVDNAVELVELREMIVQADEFLAKDRSVDKREQSLFNGEVRDKLRLLKLKERELIDSQSLGVVPSVRDNEAIGILRQVEKYMTVKTDESVASSGSVSSLVGSDSSLSSSVASDNNSALGLVGSDGTVLNERVLRELVGERELIEAYEAGSKLKNVDESKL